MHASGRRVDDRERRPGAILLVGPDEGFLRTLQILLEDEGYDAVLTGAAVPPSRRALGDDGRIGLIVLDLPAGGTPDVEAVLAPLEPLGPVVVITAFPGTCAHALARGACRVVTKPLDPAAFLACLDGVFRGAEA